MIKRVGIIAKSHKLEKSETVRGLYDRLVDRGCEVVIDSLTAERIGVPSDLSLEEVGAVKGLDLMMVLGGDGTLISVARLLRGRDIPIFGINMGSLGFLTEVRMEDIFPSLEALFVGEMRFEERIMLDVSIMEGGKEKASHTVLNDVVFNKGVLSRLVKLRVKINGLYVSSYRGDGLIISTPTGSTAYALAAGGPIIYPTIDALIVVPICPFSFANRPIVVPGDSAVEVRLESEHKDFYVTLDGQEGFEMKMKYAVVIKRAESRLKLIHLPTKNYYEVLRKKLKWGER